MPLERIDWIIIVGYFVLTLAIGAFFSRRAGKSLAEFFVSGRNLPWWIAGTSMVATTFAADNLGVSLITAFFASGIVFFSIPGVGLLIFGKYAQAAVCIGGAAACALAVAWLMKRMEQSTIDVDLN